MDSSRKRKSNATPSTEDSATKRIKLVVRVLPSTRDICRPATRYCNARKGSVPWCVSRVSHGGDRKVWWCWVQEGRRVRRSVRAWAAALDLTQPNTRHFRHTPLIHRDHLATTVYIIVAPMRLPVMRATNLHPCRTEEMCPRPPQLQHLQPLEHQR
jgi:hypothetical protein